MFKRRKVDDAPEPPPPAPPPADKVPVGMPTASTFAQMGASPNAPSNAQPGAPSGARPGAPPPAGGPTGPSAKEFPPMGRTPFPSQPQPTSNPVPPGPGTPVTPGQPPRPGLQPPQRPGAPDDRRTLVVGRGISVQGTVQDAERLVVEGTVEASLIRAQELSIAHGGVFRGTVEVEDAEIAGTIDGTLTARSNLIVRATGKVLGTAHYRRLQVEDGGQISGELKMTTADSKPGDAAAEG